MNDTRRERIRNVIAKIHDIAAEVEAIRDEECEYHEAMPESIQNSERGVSAEDAVSVLDDVRSTLEDMPGELESVL